MASCDLKFEPLLPADAYEAEVKELEEEIALDIDEEGQGQDQGVQKSTTPTVLNGHLLPISVRGKVRDNLTGIPLKEISSIYKKKDTFVVIGRGSRILYRFGEANSYIKFNGGWRNTAISILTHGVFNYFMVLAILFNCLVYALAPFEPGKLSSNSIPAIDSAPPPPPASDEKQLDYELVTKITNYISLALFILELLLKVLARGLYKSKNLFSYLQISWSWLDLFVIVVGILSILHPGSRTFAALNGFRALKLIPLIPSWLGGYDLLFRKTLHRLLHVAFFSAVLMFILGLLSTDLYYSSLRNKCILNTTAAQVFESGANFTDDMFLTYKDSTEHRACGNWTWSMACPPDYVCVTAGGSPQFGNVGFETLGDSELTLLNLVAQDFPEYVYEKIWLTSNRVHIIYGILIFFLGTFSIGTLVYAVLGHEFLKGFDNLKLELDSKCGQDNSNVWSRRFDVTPTNSWGKLRENGRKIVTHKNFDLVITVFILLDVATFLLEHHENELGSVSQESLHYIQYIVNFVYCVECFLKLVFLGIKPYFKICWNRFDFAIVVWILLATIIEAFGTPNVITGLKLVPRWPALNFIFEIMTKGVWIRWIFGINAIGLFVFAYVGYVGLGKKYTENATAFPHSEIPRWNMVDFWHSLRLIFRAFCGEWIETLWDLLLVAPRIPSIIFISASGIIGNFLVSCLGLCIILTTYNQLNSESKTHTLTSLERIFWPVRKLCKHIQNRLKCKPRKKFEENRDDDEPLKAQENDAEKEKGKEAEAEEPNDADTKKVVNGKDEGQVKGQEKDDLPPPTLPEKILSHFGYKIFVCSLIVGLTILVAYEQLIGEIIFICYFALEIIGKAALLGFGPRVSKIGLLFDGLMVINSVVALCLEQPYGIENFGTFRLLMLISRVTGLRLVRDTIWKQFKILWPYFLATFFIWYIFALGGMSLFKGGFAKCFEGEQAMEFSVIETKKDCVFNNLTWRTSPENFDSVQDGLWSLFYVATKNGWITVISNAEDMSQVDGQMKRDSFSSAMIYFVVFLIYGVLFPFASFIGIIFNDLKKQSWTEIFEQWPHHSSKTESDSKPSGSGGSKLEKYVNSEYFELWVCFTILVDSIAYAHLIEDNPPTLVDGLSILRLIILIFFIVELILRLLTLKLNFFKHWLNDLLLVVVILSITEVIMVEVAEYSVSAGMLRVFRLFHLLALDGIFSYKIPEFGSFRRALSNTFPVLTSLLTFYFLLYASFASFGAETFGGIEEFAKWNSTTALFKIATISGLDGVYHQISTWKDGNCMRDNDDDVCGYPHLGAWYIVTFIAITLFVFINIYSALILEIIHQLCNPPPSSETEVEGQEGEVTALQNGEKQNEDRENPNESE